MKSIVIFASGSGSNAEAIIRHFEQKATAKVSAIFCNNPGAYVIERAKQFNIPLNLFSREDFTSGKVLESLQKLNPDLIVLAGFLWLIPQQIVSAFPNRIINIHPALLPDFGGKGMYGIKVHQAVLEKRALKTGITIHYVNNFYDEGEKIFQAETAILPEDTAESIAAKVHELEHRHYPPVIESLLTKGASHV